MRKCGESRTLSTATSKLICPRRGHALGCVGHLGGQDANTELGCLQPILSRLTDPSDLLLDGRPVDVLRSGGFGVDPRTMISAMLAISAHLPAKRQNSPGATTNHTGNPPDCTGRGNSAEDTIR